MVNNKQMITGMSLHIQVNILVGNKNAELFVMVL